MFRVTEIFSSIEGEGKRTGQLVTFIRLYGCNLNCSYCDSRYSCENGDFKSLTLNDILENVKAIGNTRITLTGGEPLLSEEVEQLLSSLVTRGYEINIETNGSVPLKIRDDNLFYTMDYKCPSSGQEHKMFIENLKFLKDSDVIKFVVGSQEDLKRAYDVVRLSDVKAKIYLSPVFGKIEPVEIVDFVEEMKWEEANVQIQIHKIIWNPAMRGV